MCQRSFVSEGLRGSTRSKARANVAEVGYATCFPARRSPTRGSMRRKMRDPHVVALHYRVVTDINFVFREDAPPVDGELPAFRFRLVDGGLRVEMKEHHGSRGSAEGVVRPFLDAWEIDLALVRGHRAMRFEFQEPPEMIDLDPPRSGERVEIAGAIGAAVSFGTANGTVVASTYPQPPQGFVASNDVQTLMYHYEGFQAGRERLLDMANFTLSLLQSRARRRANAVPRYGIGRDVLDKLGELSATRGDGREARKLDQDSTLVPLVDREREWIHRTVRAIIRRVGEHDFDPGVSRPTITMRDLPVL